jgi:hypothetical protein
MIPPTLDPKLQREWVRIRDTARIGNQPKFTAKSVQALDAVEAYMSQLRAALVKALAELAELESKSR